MKNRREVVKHQKIALCCVLLLIISVMICSVLLGSIEAEAAASQISYKYYTSIRVEKGDTLWGIASQYVTDDYSSVNQYIEEIRSINHITGDAIHTGQYLTVPYYSSEYRK